MARYYAFRRKETAEWLERFASGSDRRPLREPQKRQPSRKDYGGRLFRFTLTSAWASGVASADIKKMDGTAVESANVEDPDTLFGSIENGDAGLCLKQAGKYWVIAPDGVGSGSTGGTLYQFTLSSGWTSGEADAGISEMDGTSVGSGTVKDPQGIFSSLASGDSGYCIEQGSFYWAIQAGCPS